MLFVCCWSGLAGLVWSGWFRMSGDGRTVASDEGSPQMIMVRWAGLRSIDASHMLVTH